MNALSWEHTLSHSAPQPPDAPVVVHCFVAMLLERYRAWRDSAAAPLDSATLDERLMSLELAEAAVRLSLPPATSDCPPQVAIMGPTQTGKSTVVNLLLGEPVAQVSPLAGFTVQAHGFASGDDVTSAAWSEALFPGWQRAQRETLDRADLTAWTLEPIDARDGLPRCVVWDTPDFDSLAAHAYRRGVLEIAALADVFVLVLSKEKYADLSVWRMLRLVRPLARPLVIVLNKMTPDARDAIEGSLRKRLSEFGDEAAGATVLPLEYRTPSAGEELLRTEIANRVAACAMPEVRRRRTQRRQAGVRALLRTHWAAWTAPIAAEREALQEWEAAVQAGLRDALASYERDYLEHPQRYDGFRRATVELLNLLELPGVGDVLGRVRQVVTWPARQLFSAGLSWWRSRAAPDGGPRSSAAEEVVIAELVERLLTGLERDARRRADESPSAEAVWKALAERLQSESSELRERFAALSSEMRAGFEPEIHAAANRLYDMLKQRPALLNSLRAARATTDVASIALAIKTGGLHPHDLVLAPAMFAVTSFLTEGALGAYMVGVADDLKRRQREHVRRHLFDGGLAPALLELSRRLSGGRLFGVAPEEADAAAAALQEWERDADG